MCDMVITTFLVSIVMVIVWKKPIWEVALFAIPFGFIEIVYLSSQMVKFKEGGFLPLISAAIFTMVMGVWFYVEKAMYKNKLVASDQCLIKLVNDVNTNRIPGIGVLFTEPDQEIPPIFPHIIANIPCIHSVVVFVLIKPIPISSVAFEERFIFQRVEARECKIFHCILRRGYNDVTTGGDSVEFESQLVQQLKEFIQLERNYMLLQLEKTISDDEQENAIVIPRASSSEGGENDTDFIEMAWKEGVVYLLGETEIVAGPDSTIFKKIMVITYNFLRKNFQPMDVLMAAIPRKRLLKVGITYEI